MDDPTAIVWRERAYTTELANKKHIAFLQRLMLMVEAHVGTAEPTPTEGSLFDGSPIPPMPLLIHECPNGHDLTEQFRYALKMRKLERMRFCADCGAKLERGGVGDEQK